MSSQEDSGARQVTEKLSPTGLEIKIPEGVKQDFREGVTRLGETLATQKPDLVIVLQRSGSLFKPTVQRLMGDSGPKIIEANIGGEISGVYSDQLFEEGSPATHGTKEEACDPNLLIERTSDQYSLWLKGGGNKRVETQLKEVVDGIRSDVGENGLIKRVLVVDDASYAGDTLRFTAPVLVKMALGEEVEVIGQTIITKNNRWLTMTLAETFGPTIDQEEAMFIYNTSKGSLDILDLEAVGLEKDQRVFERESRGLVPITDTPTLELLEEYLLRKNKSDRVLAKLREKFSDDFLIHLSSKISEAFLEASK